MNPVYKEGEIYPPFKNEKKVGRIVEIIKCPKRECLYWKPTVDCIHRC